MKTIYHIFGVVLFLLLAACGGSNTNEVPSNPDIEAVCDASHYKQAADVTLQKLELSETFPLITSIEFFPENDQIFYILQQTGEVSRVEKSESSYQVERLVNLSDFYDVYFSQEGPGSCHECGLYGMAFHPDFENNGYVYFSFTEGGHDDQNLVSFVARFSLENNGTSVVMNADNLPFREDIYSVDQPSWIHNNGKVRFGPDGFLYLSFGDGGVNRSSQNPTNVFGSILRLTDEGIAAEGNLVDQGLDEIFAFGFRNPWSWSFDKLTGELWLGDVGSNSVEEVNLIQNGGNYGWPCYEGNRENESCSNTENVLFPVVDYHHIEGRSVTGGYVYRGQELPELYGNYIFGDFVSGVIWRLDNTANPANETYTRKQLIASNAQISSFAEDNTGELYILDYFTGEIYKISAPETNEALKNIPEKLSETGCIDMSDPTLPRGNIIAYEINEPFWSDNAGKSRFAAIPENKKITINHEGDFELPSGSILVKNFHLDEQLIETRLLLNLENAGWSGYSYQWNEEQTEARLLDSFLDENIAGQVWHYPGREECKACHTPAAGFSLGLEVAQLNREIIHPENGKAVNQLQYWQSLGLFETEIDGWLWKTLVNSKDNNASLDERARSYLHSNCSQCHRPEGTTQAALDFRYDTHLPQSNACKTMPLRSDIGLAMPLIIDPGYSDNSVLFHRINRRDNLQMPPLGSTVIDEHGVRLLDDWISNLSYCDSIVGPIEFNYTLRNVSSGLYLSSIEDELTIGATANNPQTFWQLEPAVEKYYRIANAENSNLYLHTEEPGIHLGRAPVYWLSAMWEMIPDGDAWLIRSFWRNNHYIGVENNNVSQGELAPNKEGQRWEFEAVE